MSRYRAAKAMIDALKGLNMSIPAQRARIHAAMEYEPRLLYTAGTNVGGIHGKGGAEFARSFFGLPLKESEGIFGRTIAVPTRTAPPISTLPAEQLKQNLINFRNTLQQNPDAIALLPPIGMGYAGVVPDKMLGYMKTAGLFDLEKQIAPTAEMVLKGFPQTSARMKLVEGMRTATKKSLVNTSFKGSMVYPIKGKSTIKSGTTFDAITAGERTMTTRRVGLGWENRKVGEVFPITGKGGQTQLIEITHKPVIHTVTGNESQAFLKRWSELEGHGPEVFHQSFKPGQKITMVKYKPATATERPLKIISGGQIGADQLGLRIGKELGIKTGGTAPPKFQTSLGKNQTFLRDEYGLVEGVADPKIYPLRTLENVRNSDGTIIIANNWTSFGTKATQRFIKQERKPSLLSTQIKSPEDVINWMTENNIRTINIAGNRSITKQHPAIIHIYNALKTL